MNQVLKFEQFILNESKKTVSKVKIREGKMHKVLGIPANEKIEDHYKTGISLAKALVKALKGDQKKAAGMLAWAANIRKEGDIFDKALSALKQF
jgi:hypothetical protein